MPLSEHEQRLLDEMEQALYAEDPKFASHMVADPSRSRLRRRIILGSLVILIGLGVVLLGVMSQRIWVGAIGFVVMVAGGAYAVAPTSRRVLGTVDADGSIRTARRSGRGGAAPSSHGFMERLEERWDRRRHDESW